MTTFTKTKKKIKRLWRPPSRISGSEWADRYRVLSKESSAKFGHWVSQPFQVEPLDCITDENIHTIVLMSCTQMLKTETMLNAVAYWSDIQPGPIMFVISTLDLAKGFSKDRLAPMFRDTPKLRGKLRDSKSRDSNNTVLHKKFPGGHITISGSNSPDSLASRAVRYLCLDEVDRYPHSAGTEGDPIALARKRTVTFSGMSKTIISSSPTVQGESRIEREYNLSDMRVYEASCTECGHYQELKWSNLKYTEVKGRVDESSVSYMCSECGYAHSEHEKSELVSGGRWRPTSDFNGVAGFKISELYSPWQSWSNLAQDWVDAKDDKEKLRVFINTSLAETYEERGEAPNWERLFYNREDYTRGTVPDGGIVLVSGVDVQADRLELEIVAYGRDRESWSIDYRVLWGKPLKMAIDSGYASTEVYMFARKWGVDRVIAVKGSDRLQAAVGTPKKIDIRLKNKSIRNGIYLWMVGSSYLKSELYGYLRHEMVTGDEYPPGYCHFPEYDEEFFKMLTAEERVMRTTRTGYSHFEWKKHRERNESLDTRNYARAAAAALGVDYWTDSQWRRAINKTKERRPVGSKPVKLGKSGGGLSKGIKL
jgi:phage terminase large subunit GpA-like protein